MEPQILSDFKLRGFLKNKALGSSANVILPPDQRKGRRRSIKVEIDSIDSFEGEDYRLPVASVDRLGLSDSTLGRLALFRRELFFEEQGKERASFSADF